MSDTPLLPPHEPEPPKRGRGQPTKLTPELQKRMVELLEMGNYFDPVCHVAGINPETGYHWLTLARDDHPEGIYTEFSKAIAAASAQAEVNAVNLLMAAAAGDLKGDARAAIELLRRRWSGRWGDTQKIKIETAEVDRFAAAVLQVVRESLDSTITDPELRKRAIARVLDGLAQLSSGNSQSPART